MSRLLDEYINVREKKKREASKFLISICASDKVLKWQTYDGKHLETNLPCSVNSGERNEPYNDFWLTTLRTSVLTTADHKATGDVRTLPEPPAWSGLLLEALQHGVLRELTLPPLMGAVAMFLRMDAKWPLAMTLFFMAFMAFIFFMTFMAFIAWEKARRWF